MLNVIPQNLTQLFKPSDQRFQLVIASGAGLLLGLASFLVSPLLVFGGLAGILLILAVLKRPELALLGMLIISSTILGEENVPVIRLGFSIYISDIILFGLLGLIALRWIVEPDFKLIRTPLDGPLLGFYGLALLSTFIGVFQSTLTIKDIIDEVRYTAYYLSFFVVTNLVREKRQHILLLRGIFFLATLTGVAMIAQFAVGDSIHILPGRVEDLTTEGRNFSDVTRILPPGVSLVIVTFAALTAIQVINKFKLGAVWKFFQWGVAGVGVILTFTRSYWVAVGLTLLLLGYIVRDQDRQRLIKWGVALLFLLVIAVVFSLSNPKSEVAELVTASFNRFSSIFSDDTYVAGTETSTLRWRDFEYKYAIPQIISHPLLGLGLGAEYRPFVPGIDFEGGYNGQKFIHNAHLWIMLKSGILGYLCVIWLSVTFMVRGLKYWRHIPDLEIRGSVLGFTLLYPGLLVAAITFYIFSEWIWIPVIGIMIGSNEVALRLLAKQQNSTANLIT